jgi:hypothetical protein
MDLRAFYRVSAIVFGIEVVVAVAGLAAAVAWREGHALSGQAHACP